MESILGELWQRVSAKARTPMHEPIKLSQLIPIRPQTPWPKIDERLAAQWRSVMRNEKLTRKSLQLKGYRYQRYQLLDCKSDREQNIFDRLQQIRDWNRSGDLLAGAAEANAVIKDLSGDDSHFAWRAQCYANQERIARGIAYGYGTPARQIEQARRNLEMWVAPKDFINAAAAMVEEAMLHFALYVNDRKRKYINNALTLVELAEKTVLLKCRRTEDRGAAVYVLQKALCKRLRFSGEIDIPVSQDDCKRLLDYTLELGDDWSRHERLRALAERARATRSLGEAEVNIDDGVAMWEQSTDNSRYAFLDWLRIILGYWIERTKPQAYSDPHGFAEIYWSWWRPLATVQQHWEFAPLLARLGKARSCEGLQLLFASRMASFRVPLLLR